MLENLGLDSQFSFAMDEDRLESHVEAIIRIADEILAGEDAAKSSTVDADAAAAPSTSTAESGTLLALWICPN